MEDIVLMTISILLLLIVALSLATVIVKDLLTCIILMSGASLLGALVFYIANAPDVAITEAAVGVGLSNIAFLWILRATKEVRKR